MIIDVDNGKLKVKVQDKEVNFNVFEDLKYPLEKKDCSKINVLDEAC